MDISAIRKANLIKLLEKYSTQKEFAELVDTPTSYITQITQGTLGKMANRLVWGTLSPEELKRC